MSSAALVKPTAPALFGMFVQDALAIFAKRLFLAATFIGLLAGISRDGVACGRRGGEYHLLLLSSLLGMLVLSSARDLILLFVAFELMSIPLYVLAGFLKSQDESVEAALKFFLVGSVSSAVMAYGLSFVYGATRTTDLARVAQTFSVGQPLLMLGLLAVFAGFAFKIAALPVSHVGARHVRGRLHALRGVALGGPEGGRLRRAVPRLLRGHGRARPWRGCRSRRASRRSRSSPAT